MFSATGSADQRLENLKLNIYTSKKSHVLRGSSMVEQRTVNPLVPGPSPGLGADDFLKRILNKMRPVR